MEKNQWKQYKWSALKDLEKEDMITFNAWNSISVSYDQLKKLGFPVLSFFGSTYLALWQISLPTTRLEQARERFRPASNIKYLFIIWINTARLNKIINPWKLVTMMEIFEIEVRLKVGRHLFIIWTYSQDIFAASRLIIPPSYVWSYFWQSRVSALM